MSLTLELKTNHSSFVCPNKLYLTRDPRDKSGSEWCIPSRSTPMIRALGDFDNTGGIIVLDGRVYEMNAGQSMFVTTHVYDRLIRYLARAT